MRLKIQLSRGMTNIAAIKYGTIDFKNIYLQHSDPISLALSTIFQQSSDPRFEKNRSPHCYIESIHKTGKSYIRSREMRKKIAASAT